MINGVVIIILKDDLTFSLNKSHAGRFYLLKPGDTTIFKW